jgi:carboxyl-terminal processing protease
MPVQPFDRPALMASFADFLRNKKFTYTSNPERHFNELKESMKSVQQGNIDSGLPCITAMQQEIDRLKEQEIEKESADVAHTLEVEIIRHYNDRIARHAELDHDPVVKKAVEVLSDSRSYSRILHP